MNNFNLLHKQKKAIVVHLVLICITAMVVIPLIYVVIKATQDTVTASTISLKPGPYIFRNIVYALENYNFAQLMKNTLIIASSITIGKTIFSILAAMVLIYFKLPAKSFIFALILLTFYMPTDVIAVGLFNLVSQRVPSWSQFLDWISNPIHSILSPIPFGLQWTNTYYSVVVPFLASATGTYLFVQHFRSIPRSFVEVALIEGITPISFLFRILIPISLNTIGALWVIQFVSAWNQYFWPRIILRDNSAQVIQVGLGAFYKEVSQVDWSVFMAATLLVLIPPMLVFFLLIKPLRKGVALSTGK